MSVIPHDERAILEARARDLARPVVTPDAQRSRGVLLLFARGSGRYAIDTRFVIQVVPLAGFAPVPFAPAACLGLAVARGGFCPSASVLFESVAESYGPRALAVILTGMGRDGVSGLARVRAAGGRIIAQDQQTSVVFGMPSVAIQAGLADFVLPIDLIAVRILELLRLKEHR
jgi:hypothetical protein